MFRRNEIVVNTIVPRCNGVCPGGNPCVCQTMSNGGWLRHRLHICKDAKCYCHSQERYEKEKKGNEKT